MHDQYLWYYHTLYEDKFKVYSLSFWNEFRLLLAFHKIGSGICFIHRACLFWRIHLCSQGNQQDASEMILEIIIHNFKSQLNSKLLLEKSKEILPDLDPKMLLLWLWHCCTSNIWSAFLAFLKKSLRPLFLSIAWRGHCSDKQMMIIWGFQEGTIKTQKHRSIFQLRIVPKLLSWWGWWRSKGRQTWSLSTSHWTLLWCEFQECRKNRICLCLKLIRLLLTVETSGQKVSRSGFPSWVTVWHQKGNFMNGFLLGNT